MTVGRLARGISLIEAVVALAVMAIGMLGVAGLQTTLRGNADLARQRSEALRIAHRQIEAARTFSVLAAAAGARAYGSIAAEGPRDEAGSNATYRVTQTVEDAVSSDPSSLAHHAPAHRMVRVVVSWPDRTGEPQEVRLVTAIAGIAPEHGAGAILPSWGSAVEQVGGRHVAVPRGVIAQGGGTSTYVPPGAGAGVVWTFSDVTADILSVCALNTSECQWPRKLVSGYVRFALSATQPTALQSENPSDPPDAGLTVAVADVSPTGPGVPLPVCYTVAAADYSLFVCAVPVFKDGPTAGLWSGRLQFGGLPIAAAGSTDPSERRICRYSTNANGAAVFPAVPNASNPPRYVNVALPLTDQNFLVIRGGTAGPPAASFACPADDPGSPQPGGTWPHQPGP
jgi:Tfp pilus assembly protein PilV